MNTPHLDDEALSAALDGEDAAAGQHLAGCTHCRARGDELAAAAAAVGAPSTSGVTRDLADRAVAAALAAFDDERAGAGPSLAPAPASAGEGAVVVPLRRPGNTGTSVGDTFSSHRQRRRPPAWALGVAAALAAILVAVPVLSSQNDDKDTITAAGGALDEEAAELAVVDGGDLGDRADQVELGSVVASALGVEGPLAAAAPAPAAAPAADSAAEGAGTERSAAAPASPPTAAATSESTAATSQLAATRGSVEACEAKAESEFADRLGPLVYRASLRWEGKPAVVLAYRQPQATGSLDHQAVVMALDGCEILVSQGF